MNEIYKKYFSNRYDRSVTMTFYSLFINSAICLFNFGLAIYFSEAWFSLNATYYLLLALAKAYVLRLDYKAKLILNDTERFNVEYKVYRKSGSLIWLLAIVYAGIGLWMYYGENATIYKGNAVFMFALVALIKIYFAIRE